MNKLSVRVIGAGLAGSEAAWQLAERGLKVELFEMKPIRKSPAHKSSDFAELVCSNSFGSIKETTGSGMLKQEVRALGSLVLRLAEVHAVPAGNALAVDRDSFGKAITEQLTRHPNISIRREEVAEVDPSLPTIIATGPLTSDALAKSLEGLLGDGLLAYYDAVSPIVAAESINMEEVFWGARYADNADDYLNIPLTQEQYYQFIDGVIKAEKVPLHAFEEPRYFEACLPLDVLAARGRETLCHGAMKPVGLSNPKTGVRPYAVIQLRRENDPTTMLSMVGCQNKMKWPEQERLFRSLPGLQEAVFVRLGAIHRNTYLRAPEVLQADLSARKFPNLFFAGVLAGVEGYLESAATGLVAALHCAARVKGGELKPLPTSTMLGALIDYLGKGPAHSKDFQPMNGNFALLPPVESVRGRRLRPQRRQVQLEKAHASLKVWLSLTT